MLEDDDGSEVKKGKWRRPLAIAAAVLALLVAAALVAPGFVDWTRYKDRIASLAAGVTGRAVTIDGALSFRLLPSPALSAGNVAIANVAEGEAANLARVERLDIVVSPWPLLRGEIRVRRIDLIAPEIALERYADGGGNWHLAAFGEDEAPQAQSDRRLSIEALRIRRGHLAFSDGMTGRRFILEEIDARLAARSLRGPFEADIAAVMRGVPLAFRLRCGAVTPEQRVPLDAALRIGESKLSYKGWLRPHRDAPPDGKGQLQWTGPDLAALAGAVGRLADRPIALPDAAAQDYRLAASLQIGTTLELQDLGGRIGESAVSGTVRIDPDDGPHIALDLKADHLTLDPYLAGTAAPARGEGAPLRLGDTLLPPALRLDLAIAIEALRYRDGVVARTRLAATAADGALVVEELRSELPGAGTLEVSGRVTAEGGTPHARGRVALTVGDVRTAAAWLGRSLPAREGTFSHGALAGTFAWSPGTLALSEATFGLDATTATGSLRWWQRPDRPGLTADLTLDRLNLDGYLPAAGPEAADESIAAVGERINAFLHSRPVAFAPLKLRIDRLILDHAAMDDVRLTLRDAASELKVESAAIGDLHGASLELAGALAPGPETLRFDLGIKAAVPDLAALANWRRIVMPPLMDGLGRIALEGRLAGTPDRFDLDLAADLLGGRVTASGRLDGVARAGEGPAMDGLDVGADFPDPRPVIAHLGLAQMLPGAPAPVHLRGHLEGDGKAFKGRIEGTVLGGTLSLAGHLTSPLDAATGSADIAFRHPALLAFLRQFLPDYDPAARDLGGVSLAAAVSLAADQLGVRIEELRAGPAQLAGTLAYDRGGARPKLTAEIEAAELPFDRLLPPPESGPIAARRSLDRRWSREPWPVEGLRGVDATLRLRAQRLTYGPYSLGVPRLRLSLDRGLLRVEEAEAGLFGGRLTAAGSLDLRETPKLAFAFDLKTAQLASLLEAFTGLRFLSGVSSMSGRFTATGDSPAAMAATLAGRATLEARDGVIRGLDLGALSQRLDELSRPGGIGALFRTTLAGGETPLRELAATVVAKDGIVESDDVRLVHTAGDFRGRFRIALADWRVGGDGAFRFVDHPDAPPIGFVVGGSLARPHVELATDALGQWLLRRLLARAYQPIAPAKDGPAVPDIVGDGDKSTQAPPPDRVPEAIMKRFLDFMRDKSVPAKKDDGGG